MPRMNLAACECVSALKLAVSLTLFLGLVSECLAQSAHESKELDESTNREISEMLEFSKILTPGYVQSVGLTPKRTPQQITIELTPERTRLTGRVRLVIESWDSIKWTDVSRDIRDGKNFKRPTKKSDNAIFVEGRYTITPTGDHSSVQVVLTDTYWRQRPGNAGMWKPPHSGLELHTSDPHPDYVYPRIRLSFAERKCFFLNMSAANEPVDHLEFISSGTQFSFRQVKDFSFPDMGDGL